MLTAAWPGMLRRHWLVAAALLVGLVLRVLSQIAYRPALLYIDSIKYLFGAWSGADPVGYQGPLKLILLFGNLAAVAAVQHLLGLAMAVALYLLLLRRGCPAWPAALAAAPLLLDAYQLQMEQTIMPDVWFEAFAVAGLAMLLWRSSPALPAVIAAGLTLGASATVRQVGEVTLLPAVIYVLAAAGSRRRGIGQAAVLCAAFALPVLAYCSASYLQTGHFWLSRAGLTTAYGRMAAAADCAALRDPAAQRPLCPTPAQKTLGIDGLEHSPASPLQGYRASRPGTNTTAAVTAFTARVLAQQPLNVLSGIAGDAAKLFALTRNTRMGDTPISRWQFQGSYPTFSGAVELSQEDFLVLGPFGLAQSGAMYHPLPITLGRRAAVSQPAAAFLRSYQLNGGYAPGPVLAVAALAGLAGTLSIARRRARASPAARNAALGCLLMFTMAAAVLLAADTVEFSWRYQLPALVSLLPAGALGITALLLAFGRAGASGNPPGLSHQAADDPLPEVGRPVA